MGPEWGQSLRWGRADCQRSSWDRWDRPWCRYGDLLPRVSRGACRGLNTRRAFFHPSTARSDDLPRGVTQTVLAFSSRTCRLKVSVMEADDADRISGAIDFVSDPDPRIRDLSYGRSRARQLVDLFKGSFYDMGFGPQDGDAEFVDNEDWPTSRLEIYIKDKPRGPGYVCDVVYNSDDLPVTVYAVLINRGRGLEVAELELFRRNWGCFDGHDGYLHPDQQDPIEPDEPPTLITSDVLRRIPIGDILARVERDLPDQTWRERGIPQLPNGPRLLEGDLTEAQTRALDNTLSVTPRRRGRPELSDELLVEVADAYIDEAIGGRGAIRRVAEIFDRPEPTIRDWIATARRRGILAPTSPGRRGAAPGPNFPPRTTGYDNSPDLTNARRRTVLRLVEEERVLESELSEDALVMFVVSGLICNSVGAFKKDSLHVALKDTEVLSAAIEILNKARRRRAARDSRTRRGG